ncbi:MAG: ABC transporter ATP-binding protein [Ilumatobacteraceae bacterium]
MHSVRVSTWYFGLVEFAGIFATAAVLGIGGAALHDRVSLGVVVAFVLLISNLFEPVQLLSQLFNNVQSAGASLAKIYALLDHAPELSEPEQPTPLPHRGEVRLDAVRYRYEGAPTPAVVDFDLTVHDGERLALVGPTGAGKSTVAKLVARFYDPEAGSVRFGGVDLRDVSSSELRRKIVVVPQEGFLFAGTLRENVRLARPDATDRDIEAAIDRIGATERFGVLPEGLDTSVRERGSRLSAGERQLVSLARAALVDPAVLVLDEATSNLDPGTEAVVERALAELMAQRTVIVVAHRITTIEQCDRIAVVDHGRLVELGTPAELRADVTSRYAAMAGVWTTPLPSHRD